MYLLSDLCRAGWGHIALMANSLFSLYLLLKQDSFSSFLIRTLCWAWYELNPKTGLFIPSQTFTFGRGLKTVRVISQWALHLSGNRKLNLFNGVCFWSAAISISFFVHLVSQSLNKYLLSTYYMVGTILDSEVTAMNN